MRERNFIIAYLVFIVLALLYSDYSKNKLINKQKEDIERMCICIMKNDHLCKYMGFSQTKAERAQRKKIMNKYKNLL